MPRFLLGTDRSNGPLRSDSAGRTGIVGLMRFNAESASPSSLAGTAFPPPCDFFVLKSRTAESVSIGDRSGGGGGEITMLLAKGKIGGEEDEETRGEIEPRGRTGEVMRSL